MEALEVFLILHQIEYEMLGSVSLRNSFVNRKELGSHQHPLHNNSRLTHNLRSFEIIDINGLFQRTSPSPLPLPPPSPPPHGRHWIGYLKISGFPRRTTAVFAGFQSLLTQNLKEFQNFAKI